MPVKAVLFDLDGTLLDTLEDMSASVERALAKHGLPGHPQDSYRYFIGNGMAKLVERAVPAGTDAAFVEAVYRVVRSDYAAHWAVKTAPYPGIRHLINQLACRGIVLMVLTNKPDPYAREMIDHFFPEKPFHAVRGQTPAVPVKPSPVAALALLEEAGVSPREALFVGDSEVDMQTAANAGISSVGVSWGFRPVEELKANQARYIISKPEELLGLLE